MAVELGVGYVSIVPSARGIADGIEGELRGPILTASTKAGQDASKALANGAKSASGVIASEAQAMGSKFAPIGKAAQQVGSEITSRFTGAGTAILGAASAPAVLGTALVGVTTFAAKSVSAFQDLGLSVGKFSDATGLSAEASSRFVEVANDAGVSTEGLQKSIGFLQKAAGNTPAVFKELGVAIAKTSTGAVDVQQTFLNATDAIKGIEDPNARAAAGAKLFGRSWADMAELINRGSGQLKTDLESVQASKVFSAADVASARGLRAAFDSIRDAMDGVMLTLGKSLAPAIISIAPKIAKMVADAEPLIKSLGQAFVSAADGAGVLLAAIGPIVDAMSSLNVTTEQGVELNALTVGGLGAAKAAWDDATGSVELAGHVTGEYHSAQEQANRVTNAQAQALTLVAPVMKLVTGYTGSAEQAQRDLQAASDAVNRSIDAQTQKWNALKGAVADDQAWVDMQNTFADVKTKGSEAMDAVKNHTDDADQKMRDYQTSVNTAKGNVIELGNQLGLSIPTVKSMLLQIDAGQIDTVEARLRTLTRNRNISLSIQLKGGAGYGGLTGDPDAGKARGGPVSAGSVYAVGDNADGSWNRTTELFVPNVNGRILSAAQSRSLMSSTAPSSGRSGGPMIGQVVVHNDVDADGFFRMAQFHLAAA